MAAPSNFPSLGENWRTASKEAEMIPLAVISGPTASGKTAFAVELAQRLNCEIINADSIQIYKKFDIGSAKPTIKERRQAVHHLLDVFDPDQHCDAHVFSNLAGEAIASIDKRGKNSLVCGGTNLYLRALLYGLAKMPGRDEAVRQKIKEIAVSHGWEFLYEKLKSVDKAYAETIAAHDSVRITRALEVYEISGIPLSSWLDAERFSLAQPRYRTLHLALDLPRQELYRRINVRGDEIFADLLDETKEILKKFPDSLKPLRSLGYLQAAKVIRGEMRQEAALEEMKTKTRQFAKRQLTWLRKEKGVIWVSYPYDSPLWEERLKRHFSA
jgi:tRNA dimethylallyltransferase